MKMQIVIPATRPRRKANAVPPMGYWTATLKKCTEGEKEGGVCLSWQFSAERRRWTMDHQIPMDELAEVLRDLGHSGNVELEDLIGEKFTILVRTRGDRRSAFVQKMMPLRT